MRTLVIRARLVPTIGLALGLFVAGLGVADPALAASGAAAPGWELFANNYPTNLTVGANETVHLSVEEGAPSFNLRYVGSETSALAPNSSAAQIQSALEALPAIGTENIAVSATAPGQFDLEFVGALRATRIEGLETTGANLSVSRDGRASGTIKIDVFNIGAASSNGQVTVTDRLPPGLRATEAASVGGLSSFGAGFGTEPILHQGLWDCEGNGPGPSRGVAGATEITCTSDPERLEHIDGGGGALTIHESGPHYEPPIGIKVSVDPGVREGTRSGLEANRVGISGGGASQAAAASDPITLSSAQPVAGVDRADAWLSNADGTPDLQAGTHPYGATFIFTVATSIDSVGKGHVVGSEIRDLETRVPAGLVGNLSVLPQCSREQLSSNPPTCPPDSMVGKLRVGAMASEAEEQVFNLAPRPGVPAELGFFYETPVYISFGVNSGGNNSISAHIDNLPQKEPFESILELWGAPEEESHNLWRSGSMGCGPGTGEGEEGGPPYISPPQPNYCHVAAKPSPKPILRLPSSCEGPQRYIFRELRGWQESDARSEVSFYSHDATGSPAGFNGCELLEDTPKFSLSLETGAASTPTGLSADLEPQLTGLLYPPALSPADIRDATVMLPQGVSINPGQAAGLQACPPGRPGLLGVGDAITTPAESAAGEEDNEAASCPPASKIGTVLIRSPLIETAPEKQFEGNIYILPSNPPDVRVLIAASADGVNIKVPGTVHLDPQTGKVVATFEDTPQLPFSEFKLHFEGGARAALISPSQCGNYETVSRFTPWSAPFAPDALSTTSFAISAGASSGPCPSKPLAFTPSLAAGVDNPIAGGSSAFTLKVSHPDGQQNIKSIEAVLPPGQLAKLAGVPLCPAADTASGNCPQGSQVGSVSAEIGAGANPLQVPQPGKAPTAAYLAGPYKGGPYSLVVKVPAQAGPFDLGNVITRVALQVNESTTQVTAVSDPLPQILDGVPLEYKSVTVSVDRPNFVLNPTNCEPQKVTATIGGSEGANANLSNRYQVGDCASLNFKPKLALKLKGGTKRHTFPALKATLTYPKQGAYANIKKAQVTLPHSEFLEQGHIGTVCTRVQFAAKACPKASIYGKAMAISPLLDKPVSGPVYLRSSSNPLPDLVAELNGQIDVTLAGKIDTGKGGGIRNTFQAVPDAPVSKFTLELKGGKKGLLVNSENICSKPQHATADFTGQNGKVYDTTPLIANSCKSAKKSKGKKTSKRLGTSHR